MTCHKCGSTKGLTKAYWARKNKYLCSACASKPFNVSAVHVMASPEWLEKEKAARERILARRR